jgi:hypothetical protein
MTNQDTSMSNEQLAQSRAAGRKRARIRALVTLAVLTVALVGVLVAVSRGADSKADGYRADDCLSIGGSTVISDATKVACTEPNAAYVVVNKLAGSASCDPSYATYTVTKDDAKSTVEAAYCLRLNGLQGDCFRASESVVSFTPIASRRLRPGGQPVAGSRDGLPGHRLRAGSHRALPGRAGLTPARRQPPGQAPA